MSDLVLLGSRLTIGGYLAAHGSQKLFGKLGGYGIEGTGGFFETLGLRPGRHHATAAGAAEFGGGLLTAAGLAYPLGPVAIAATMAVAATTAHRGKGPFAAEGGPELALTNLAAAAALAAAGPGRISIDHLLGTRLPRSLTRLVLLGGVALAVGITARAMSAQRADEPPDEEPPPAPQPAPELV